MITTSSACTSGSQGIGYAYEAIKYGRQKAMVAGGAKSYALQKLRYLTPYTRPAQKMMLPKARHDHLIKIVMVWLLVKVQAH